MGFPRTIQIPENAFEGKRICPLMTGIISISANILQLWAHYKSQQTLKIISPELVQSGIVEDRIGVEMIGCECLKEQCCWFRNGCCFMEAIKCQQKSDSTSEESK